MKTISNQTVKQDQIGRGTDQYKKSFKATVWNMTAKVHTFSNAIQVFEGFIHLGNNRFASVRGVGYHGANPKYFVVAYTFTLSATGKLEMGRRCKHGFGN